MKFSSPEELAAWLQHHQIDTRHWGTGNAKSVADLWREVQAGESHFEDGHALRRVHVASLVVIQDDKQLIEALQVFHDGRKRVSDRAPSEKLKLGETAQAAARRCLWEEIGCSEENVVSPPILIRTEEQLLDSPSYPGLTSRFKLHLVRCAVRGLPAEEFVTRNRAQDDPVASLHWRWEPL